MKTKFLSLCTTAICFFTNSLFCNGQTEAQNNMDNNLNFISCSNTDIRYDGRIQVDNQSAKLFYPGSSISIEFTGTRLEADFSNSIAYYRCSFKSDNNGEEIFTFCTNEPQRSRTTHVVLVKDLENGKHMVTITLISEGIYRNPEFFGFYVDKDATISRPKDKSTKNKFEFIGNSITCGYGTEVTDRSPYNDSTSNFCHSFAFRTADYFNADYMVVARSGIGIYRNFGDKDTASAYGCMPDNYEKFWLDSPLNWDFSLFQPWVVFINLGTNDTWEMSSFNAKKYEENYRKLMETLTLHYAGRSVHYVLLTGSMMGQEALQAVKPILDKIQHDYWAKGYLVYRFDFTPTAGLGADWHPCAAQQEDMSKELIQFLLDKGIARVSK